MSIETVEYALACLEDLDIGTGTRSVHLADGGTVTLHQISLGALLTLVTRTIQPASGAALATLTGFLPAGARVFGVTTEILASLGTTQGLSSFAIGDATLMDRWGAQSVLTAGAQTDQGDFHDASLPVYPADTDVVVSAIGGVFDGVGNIEVTLHYLLLTHRSA
jgi:hypothetical protein